MKDKAIQNATVSPAQQLAIDSLLSGCSVTDAATAAGVCRSTLYRWLNDDFSFVAELNRRKHEIRDRCRSRLLALAERAVSTVESAIETDTRLAVSVLRNLGLLDPESIGSTDPEKLEEEKLLRRVLG